MRRGGANGVAAGKPGGEGREGRAGLGNAGRPCTAKSEKLQGERKARNQESVKHKGKRKHRDVRLGRSREREGRPANSGGNREHNEGHGWGPRASTRGEL